MYGRWGTHCIDLLPRLARERTRGMNVRLRRGAAIAHLHRWSGVVAVALQRAVAAAVLRDAGADLATTLLEPIPGEADLSNC